MSYSLIDCKERPLRRSVVSPDTGEPQEVDWSPIQPTKVTNNNVGQSQQPTIKSSLGESVIEGMHNLSLTGNPGEYDTTRTNQTGTATDSYDNESRGNVATATPLSRSLTGTRHPLSPPQLPKPRDPMLRSLSHHVEAGPSIRQTRTSTMRVQNSLDKRFGSSPSTRHGVTEAGSPYSFPSRSNSGNGKGNAPADEYRHYNPQESVGSASTEKKASYKYDPSQYKSSLPLPIRSRHQSPEPSNPACNAAFNPQNSSGAIEAYEHESQNHSSGAVPAAELQGSGNQSAVHELPAALPHEHFEATRKILADLKDPYVNMPVFDDTPEGSADDSNSPVDTGTDNPVAASPENSTHGHDEHGGFRVVRLRQTTGGPTLRVRHEASQLLLGQDDTRPSLAGSNSGLRRRETRRDLRATAASESPARRTRGSSQRGFTLGRSITSRSFATCQAVDGDDDMRRLIPDADDDRDDFMPGDDGELHDWEQDLPSAYVHHLIGGESSSMHLTSGYGITTTQGSSPKGPEPEPISRLRTRPSNICRRSTVTRRVDPNKQNAPVLFQGLEEEEFSQQQSVNDLPSHIHGMEPAASTPAAANHPTRTSSQKPKSKPAPIDVSSPKRVKTGNRFPEQPLKAQGSKFRGLRKPKLVKTFSQSISPGPDVASESHDGPSSGKGVLSQMRGLFAKRSTESQQGGSRVSNTLRKIPSKLGARNFDSVRHNRVRQSAKFPNTLLNPASAVHESSRSNTTTQGSVISDPFADPVTPFTAGIMASPATSDPESQDNPDSATPVSPASASLIVHRPSTPSMSETPPPPASFDSATELVQTLLNRAFDEPEGERKDQFIELSKCMVAIINKARDGAKALEQAKIEASKAEVTWLKIQQDMDHLVELVRNMLANLPN